MARTEAEILQDIEDIEADMKSPSSFKIDDDIEIKNRAKKDLDAELATLQQELDDVTGSSTAPPISSRTQRRFFRNNE